jgi:hypothetical protein
MGPDAGANTLNAVVSGVGFVAFTATGTSSGGSRLEFRVQPSDTEEKETMSPPVEIGVLDESGDPVTDRVFPIKLELLDHKNHVKGEGTRNTEAGVATFSGIRIFKDGDYRLRASTDGLASILSDQFEIQDD